MSRKNRKTRTANAATTAATDDRHLHAVADDLGQQNAPTTEDKVRAALTDNPGSTTAKLAMAGGVGRSTAAKILARWDRDGTAIRTAGDGPRNPDTWTLAPSTSDTAAPDIDEAQTDTTAPPSTDQPTDDTDIDGTVEDPGATEAATDADGSTAEDTTAAVPGPEAGSDADDTNVAADTTPAPPTDGDGTIPPPDTAQVDPVDGAAEPEPSSAAAPVVSESADTAATDKDRLPKGGLRALVEEYLTEHPGETFGPAKIGKELGRSGGAVNNALEKLVTDGYAIKTCEAPKRFAINPDKTDVPETTDGSGEPAAPDA
ncbi:MULTISPECIES: hypothetical protein [Amycolatopsis]|uniref:Uncharacterized protein n=3 Tax=Amycolatopsis TaxID=1813 RepID=A0A2N3WF07_9PSEU|nr:MULTISPECIES: hypothetical protein [Amycolatopsis]MBB2505967.1 hypothetical protein [Amycolatopsis echigonensis]PKV92445.1 hypothetical protein ATK30_3249 [Amycolatopsis niigatensis]TVT16792.1 hypothetical protein FNH06_34055 [Amycolatopsis acidiphila]GHG80999.1 hypothetical protein GCM10017788_50550 [Amycolatopsis acidiphila]